MWRTILFKCLIWNLQCGLHCFAHFTQIYGSIAHNCRRISGSAIKRCSVFRLIDVQAEQCWIQEVVCRRLTYPSEHQKVPQNILNIMFIDALEMQFPSEFYSVSHLCCRNPSRRKILNSTLKQRIQLHRYMSLKMNQNLIWHSQTRFYLHLSNDTKTQADFDLQLRFLRLWHCEMSNQCDTHTEL